MKYCKNCGSQMNDEAGFCPNCGSNASESTAVVSQNQSYNSSNIKERSLALAIILSLITCGIYSIYWMIKVNDEALELSGEKGSSGGVVFLLNLITCGIYGFFWAYKMGNCVDVIKGNRGGNTGVLYLVLTFLGLNIVNMALIQDTINNKVN